MDARTRRSREDETVRLDSEGNWFHGEFPILHERTVQFLYKNIALDEDGCYYLTGEDKPIYFHVDEVPYWITNVERTIAGYLITLTDGSMELLDLNNVWMGKGNKLYCVVKGGTFPAKFNRNTFYEVMKDLEREKGKFVIVYNKKRYFIQSTAPKGIVLGSRKGDVRKKKKSQRNKKHITSARLVSDYQKASEQKQKKKDKAEKKSKRTKLKIKRAKKKTIKTKHR